MEGNIILAKPAERTTAQPFRIYKITTPLTGLLEINARHIQYQENFITVSPFSTVGSQAAMAAISSHVTTACPFSFWTDIDSSATFTITSLLQPSCVLRYPDQKVALKIAQLAVDAALNDKVGYDQSQNRTYLSQLKAVGWEPSKITVTCEADCSAGVCVNITAAGYLLGIPALQKHTGTYTGNMRSALIKAGFTLLTDSKYLTSGDYLLPGDILLNDGHHTATNVTIGSKVKGDWKPTGSTPAAPTPAPTTTKYYRVRKNWADKASQIGAFTVFQNAKNCVDANPGYAAFDDNGNQVYPEVKETFSPYLVRVSIDDLNIRTGPGTDYSRTGEYTGKGVFTIVQEQDG